MSAAVTSFGDLTYVAAEALSGKPVVLLPVGALEPHGPHAPLATDTLISLAVCRQAVRMLGHRDPPHAVVLPPVAYGVTHFSETFAGSVGIGAEVLRALVSDICRSLERQGLRRRIIVNSHFEPEHVAALRAAAADTGSTLFDVTRRKLAERLTDEFRSGAAHAGRYETSLLLAVHPELVDDSSRTTLAALRVDMPAAMAAGSTTFLAMGMDRAYCGSPSEATAAEGEATLETLGAMLVELISAVNNA